MSALNNGAKRAKPLWAESSEVVWLHCLQGPGTALGMWVCKALRGEL